MEFPELIQFGRVSAHASSSFGWIWYRGLGFEREWRTLGGTSLIVRANTQRNMIGRAGEAVGYHLMDADADFIRTLKHFYHSGVVEAQCRGLHPKRTHSTPDLPWEIWLIDDQATRAIAAEAYLAAK